MPNRPTRIDPKKIIVREDRQRRENIADVSDLKQSIEALAKRIPDSCGLINPILVRQEGEETILVAGGRRLKATLELGFEETAIRFFEDLSPEEAEIVELTENIKRADLSWRDQVRAVGRIHSLYKKRDSSWKLEQTAEAVSLQLTQTRKILHVFNALDSGRLAHAESIEQAYNTLHRFAERKAEEIVGQIIVRGAQAFSADTTIKPMEVDTNFTTVSAISVAEVPIGAEELLETLPASPLPTPRPVVSPPPPSDPVICVNFLEWAKTYSGPKFTLIHCDFPYGNYKGGDSQGALGALETEDFYDNDAGVYWTLLDGLITNIDRIMSYSAHLLFWLDMSFYTETVSKLRKTGLFVHDHPLIWFKSGGPGGRGVVPGTAVTYPRRTYDTALLCVRGKRPLAKPGQNGYPAPTVGDKIHPSQKSEPMLRVFLSMLVDETTSMLDPTCGSGSSLRAAEDLGAKYVLGLELDPNYAKAANTRTLQARVLRQAGMKRQVEII